MMPIRTALYAALVLSMTGPLLAAKQPSEKEMLRQEAEHVCYGDAQRLCADAMPDEARVEACMRAKRAQVSAECKKVFDKASKM